MVGFLSPRRLFGWFLSRRAVVCFGETHLDTIATSEEQVADGGVHVGKIVHAVGGHAFNVASNLAREDIDNKLKVRLFTVLPAYSILSQVFYRKMRENRIGTAYVHSLKDINERPVRGGGYVALMSEKDHITRHAVNEPALNRVDLFGTMECGKRARKAVKWGETFVAAGSLSAETLSHLLRSVKNQSAPLFVILGSVAEGRTNWLDAAPEEVGECTALCARLDVLLGTLEDRVPPLVIGTLKQSANGSDAATLKAHAAEICRALGVKHVVWVSAAPDEKGEVACSFSAIAANQSVMSFRASDDVNERLREGNSAGLADAALSGFIRAYHTLAKRRSGRRDPVPTLDFDNPDVQRSVKYQISRIASHVAESRGATPGSVISLEEEESLHSRWVQGVRYLKMAIDVTGVRYLLNGLLTIIGAAVVAYLLINYGVCETRFAPYLRFCPAYIHTSLGTHG
jgi:hypothetical protein